MNNPLRFPSITSRIASCIGYDSAVYHSEFMLSVFHAENDELEHACCGWPSDFQRHFVCSGQDNTKSRVSRYTNDHDT